MVYCDNRACYNSILITFLPLFFDMRNFLAMIPFYSDEVIKNSHNCLIRTICPGFRCRDNLIHKLWTTGITLQ